MTKEQADSAARAMFSHHNAVLNARALSNPENRRGYRHTARCQSREPVAVGVGEQCVLVAGHAARALHVGKSGRHWEGPAYVGVAVKKVGAIVSIDERLANLEGGSWRRRA